MQIPYMVNFLALGMLACLYAWQLGLDLADVQADIDFWRDHARRGEWL